MSTPQENQQVVEQQQQQQQQQQPQQPQQPQQQLQGPQPVVTPSTINNGGENLQCQWQGCGERCVSAEALYVSSHPLDLLSTLFGAQT